MGAARVARRRLDLDAACVVPHMRRKRRKRRMRAHFLYINKIYNDICRLCRSCDACRAVTRDIRVVVVDVRVLRGRCSCISRTCSRVRKVCMNMDMSASARSIGETLADFRRTSFVPGCSNYALTLYTIHSMPFGAQSGMTFFTYSTHTLKHLASPRRGASTHDRLNARRDVAHVTSARHGSRSEIIRAVI